VEKDFHLEISTRRRENKSSTGGFQLEEAIGECCVLQIFMYSISIHVQRFQWIYSCTNMGLLKESHIHLEKHAVLVCTIGQAFPGLFEVIFLLVGNYPCYTSSDFSIIKSLSTMVFSSRFFQGYLPENFGVLMFLIWFPCLCFHSIFGWLLMCAFNR
jgi:hypothetical protein